MYGNHADVHRSGDGCTAQEFAMDVRNDIMRQFILDAIDEAVARRPTYSSEPVLAEANSS